MTTKEIKLKLVERLLRVQKEIDDKKENLGDPVMYHHNRGYLEAADGMFGERQFLEKILEQIGDVED